MVSTLQDDQEGSEQEVWRSQAEMEGREEDTDQP